MSFYLLLFSRFPSKPGWIDRHMSPEQSTYGWWWWSKERTALGNLTQLIIAIMRYEQRKAISLFSRSSACNFECFWNDAMVDGAAVNLIWVCESQRLHDERWTSKADQKLQLILMSPGDNCDSKSTSHLENNNIVKECVGADFPIRN